jgi:GEVED domain/HYR domain/Domain of unknown function DUF11/Secretion system C-terminal sorting domain
MNYSRLFYFRIPLPMVSVCSISILMLSTSFLSAQNAGIFKTYNAHAATSAMGEFNNGSNFLINNCNSNNQASYLWTDAQGNLLATENDFVGSCGHYRYDSIYYVMTGSGGSEPSRDVSLSKMSRNNTVVWTKTYPLSMDNFGQFVIPTNDKGFMVVGATQVPNDTTYKVQLIKTDSLGNLQWQKVVSQGLIYSRIRRPNGTGCTDLINSKQISITKIWQTTDGGYYMEYATNEPPADCSLGKGDGAVVVRLDGSGNYLWHKANLSNTSEGKYHNIFPAENGNLLVLMTHILRDTGCTKYSYKLSKYSPLGDTLWAFERKQTSCSNPQPQNAGAITLFRNGDVYLETQLGTVVRKISGTTGLQLDSLVVPKQTGLTQATNMIETRDGSFAMVGGTGEVVYFYKNKFPTLVEKYCTSKSSAPWELWISNVLFSNINNASDKFKDYATLGYSDFTSLSTTIATGRSYPLSITPGLSWSGVLPTAFCRAWIDFNRNGIFEDTEKVLERNNANPMTANVLIPTNAAVGDALMRISLKMGSYPTPCETFDKGEVEDYTITIVKGIDPCENDVIAPIIACPANMTVTIPMNQDSALVNLSLPSVTDACDHITLIATLPDGENVLPDTKFPTGTTVVTWTAYDISHNSAACNFNVTLVKAVVDNTQDIALGITTTPEGYRPYSNINFIISAKNTGSQPFTGVKIEFKYPEFTAAGGTATPSVGTWQEWCSGGIQCFTWSIPSLAANSTATLTIPIFVINLSPPLVGTTKLLASTPVDNVVRNNIATVSVNPAPAFTDFVPFIQKIAPNPTSDHIVIELESSGKQTVVFTFLDAYGQTLKTAKRNVERGTNQLPFDIQTLPKGVYFVTPLSENGKSAPTKFVKIN